MNEREKRSVLEKIVMSLLILKTLKWLINGDLYSSEKHSINQVIGVRSRSCAKPSKGKEVKKDFGNNYLELTLN